LLISHKILYYRTLFQVLCFLGIINSQSQTPLDLMASQSNLLKLPSNLSSSSYRTQYNDLNQNMFPQFDAHRISSSSLSHLTILQASNNPKSPYFEEDNDNVQVPQHIKFLFSISNPQLFSSFPRRFQ